MLPCVSTIQKVISTHLGCVHHINNSEIQNKFQDVQGTFVLQLQHVDKFLCHGTAVREGGRSAGNDFHGLIEPKALSAEVAVRSDELIVGECGRVVCTINRTAEADHGDNLSVVQRIRAPLRHALVCVCSLIKCYWERPQSVSDKKQTPADLW